MPNTKGATSRLIVTGGIKDARYDQHFEQYQDNGKAGCLGGVLDKTKTCIGGVQFYPHGVQYDKWLPLVAARYRVRSNWSAYAQFGEGSQIPPTNVFDVPAGTVKTPPNQTLAKTYQIGSVTKFNRTIPELRADFETAVSQDGFGSPQLIGANSMLEARIGEEGPDGKSWFEAQSHQRRAEQL